MCVSVWLSSEADWSCAPAVVRPSPPSSPSGLSSLHCSQTPAGISVSVFWKWTLFKKKKKWLQDPFAAGGSWELVRGESCFHVGSRFSSRPWTWHLQYVVRCRPRFSPSFWLFFSSWTIRKQWYCNTLSDCRCLSGLRPQYWEKKTSWEWSYMYTDSSVFPSSVLKPSPLHSLWFAVGHHWSLSDNCTATYFIYKAINFQHISVCCSWFQILDI